MTYRLAILDDYQNVALKLADWSSVTGELDIKVFNHHLGGDEEVIKALQGFQIIKAMRERTRFSRKVIEALPDLKLIITTGMRNASIDVKAANERGIVVCGTGGFGNPTTGVAVGLMLELTRKVGFENARMKAGEPWQIVLGEDLEGKTLGVVGLGKLGTRVAKVMQALGMKVIAWSQNLTAEKAQAAGAELVSKEQLFAESDAVSIHLVLGPRSRGLIGAADFARMKKGAIFINTSRGPIVDEVALIAAIREGRIFAALDVFDHEPLPVNNPFRDLPNTVLTPHLGFTTVEGLHAFYQPAMENILAFLDGKPVNLMNPDVLKR